MMVYVIIATAFWFVASPLWCYGSDLSALQRFYPAAAAESTLFVC